MSAIIYSDYVIRKIEQRELINQQEIRIKPKRPKSTLWSRLKGSFIILSINMNIVVGIDAYLSLGDVIW